MENRQINPHRDTPSKKLENLLSLYQRFSLWFTKQLYVCEASENCHLFGEKNVFIDEEWRCIKCSNDLPSFLFRFHLFASFVSFASYQQQWMYTTHQHNYSVNKPITMVNSLESFPLEMFYLLEFLMLEMFVFRACRSYSTE